MKRVTFNDIIQVRKIDVGRTQHIEEIKNPQSFIVNVVNTKNKIQKSYWMWWVIGGIILFCILFFIYSSRKNRKKNVDK